MTEPETKKPNPNPVREAILTLTAECEVGKTIHPVQAAQLVSEEHWRRVLKDVRHEAIRLAKAGTITIYRKGKPVADLDKLKGVYRLGLPPQET